MLYQLMVAELAYQRGDIDTAINNYLEIAVITKDPKVAERATQIASYSQDPQKALKAADLWVSTDVDNLEARRMYAGILLKSGRAFEAIPQYEKMIEMVGDNTAKVYGIIVSQLARFPEKSVALSIMEKITQTHQKDPNALFAYAHLAMRQAQFDMALTTLDNVLVLKPNWPSAITMRTNIMAMKGEKDEALAYLDSILKGELEDNIEVNITYARMLTEFRKVDEAFEQYKKMSNLVPDNADILYSTGVLALQLEKYDQAKKYLKETLTKGERAFEANFYLGQVAEAEKKEERAIDYYSSVKRGRLYFNAQLRVVALLADKRDYARARDHLHTIRLSNEQQQLQVDLVEGDLYREEGRYKDAKQFYSELLDRSPNETSIRYARALVAEKLGELELVESDLQAILEIEPSNAQVLNALGYTLADRTDRYEEALGYIKKALEIEPNDAAVMDSMGWVLYHLGNYKESIAHLTRANELGRDPEIAAHLGEVL